MTFLKGRIRGASKTQLGTNNSTIRGQGVNATDKRSTIGQPQEFMGVISEVMQKDMDGEKVLFPYVRVKIVMPNGGAVVEYPYWLKITNSPDEIDTIYGGLQNVSEAKPLLSVKFSSQTRRGGTATLGTHSSDVDDYSGGQIKEYEGVQIV